MAGFCISGDTIYSCSSVPEHLNGIPTISASAVINRAGHFALAPSLARQYQLPRTFSPLSRCSCPQGMVSPKGLCGTLLHPLFSHLTVQGQNIYPALNTLIAVHDLEPGFLQNPDIRGIDARRYEAALRTG